MTGHSSDRRNDRDILWIGEMKRDSGEGRTDKGRQVDG